MRATILGCGASAGVPQIGGADGRGDWGACDPAEPRNHRTRSSIVIEGEGGQRLLIDTGPDLREQLLACSIGRIDAILYTHSHADHIAGLDDVRILNRVVDRPLEAFATASVLEDLSQRFEYAFRPWSPPGFFRPVLLARPVVPGLPVTIAGMQVQLFNQTHGAITTLGIRIGDLAYCTDVAAFDDTAMNILQGVKTFVVGCFQRRPHRTHANIDQVITWTEQIRPERTILTHMSHDLDWAWLKANLPPNIQPAHDGLVLTLP